MDTGLMIALVVFIVVCFAFYYYHYDRAVATGTAKSSGSAPSASAATSSGTVSASAVAPSSYSAPSSASTAVIAPSTAVVAPSASTAVVAPSASTAVVAPSTVVAPSSAGTINIANPPPGYYIDQHTITSANPGDQWPANPCQNNDVFGYWPYFQLSAICPGTTPGLLNGGGGKCTTRLQSAFSTCQQSTAPGPSPFTLPVVGSSAYY
jgi:hypothetical protein